MKTYVINELEESRVPFFRGILTRSLLDAGLSFEESYELATIVRDELSDVGEISTEELRGRVNGHLKQLEDQSVLENYQAAASTPARIKVESLSGTSSTFSRGRHRRYLQASGLRLDKAEATTGLIYDQLVAAGVEVITTCQLGFLTYLCLQQEISKKAARKYLVWSDYERTGRPLLLLIGGAVGSGKSSIATEVAHQLEIVRTQSTDMLREVMRMMLPERLLPVLHASSFDAWKFLPVQEEDSRDKDQLIAAGYKTQVDLLAVPCEAVLQRAIRESVPIILEGVHAHPDLVARIPADNDAIIVHVTLAVLRSKQLKSRLKGRGVQAPERRAKRYLNKFDSIWSLQSFLLSESDRLETAIITNDDKENAVYQVVNTIGYELAKQFKSTPEEVFGEVTQVVAKEASNGDWRQLVALLCN